MIFLRRLLAISIKELRQLRRDRTSVQMLLLVPIIQLALFGYAINTDVRQLRAAVVDNSQTAYSRQIIAELQATQVLKFVDTATTPEELERMIRRGHVSVGLYIPADAHRRSVQGNRKTAQLLVDGSDPVIGGAVAQLRNMPLAQARYTREQFDRGNLQVRVYYNPEKRSAVNVVPGLIGVILTFTMVLFTAIAIVREKEQGTHELLIATPLSSLQLMLGKVFPYIGIGLLQACLVLLMGWWVFEVPVNGALVDLLLACLVFVAASLSLGLVISTFAGTQMQAMQMTIFAFIPSMLLSGFMFPFDGMPPVAQWLAEILPLTHFLRIVRGIVLRGAHLSEMMLEVYVLAGFFLVTLSIAVLRFKKRLD